MKDIKEQLAILLATYQVFYTNVHGYHWNIMGEKFFEAHAKFGELYDCIAGPIDLVAERIRALGGFPTHKMSDYLKQSNIPEAKQTINWEKDVRDIQVGLTTLITLQKHLLSLAQAQQDYGTEGMVATLIEHTEKKLWFYNSYLPPKEEKKNFLK